MNEEEFYRTKICSICGESYHGFGNNAFPVNPGHCCDSCNAIVTHARHNNIRRGVGPQAYPEWYNAELLAELKEYLAKPVDVIPSS